MKILVFTTLFPNKVMTNKAIFVKERIRNLAKRFNVRVVTPVPYFPKVHICKKWSLFNQIPLEEEIEGLKVYHPRYFITPKVLRSLYGIFMFLSVFKFIKKRKGEFNFDIIDAHFVYPDGLAAVLLAKLLRKKVIVTVRGTDINWYSKFPIIRKLIQYTFNNADGITCVSESLKEKIVRLGISDVRVNVVENGVDTDVFRPVSKEDTRLKLGIPKDKKILLSVGNLLESKGFHLLIETLNILQRKDIYLYIVGEGPYRKQLEKLISKKKINDRVKLVGEISHKELPQWYSASDLFCLVSLREGRPNVVLEALSCGVPVVSMNQWGLSKFVNKDRGILIDSYTPEVISETIEEALQKEWDSKIISSFMKNFRWDNTIDKLEKIYKNVLEQRDIMFFSSDDWDSGLKTSKYHIAIRLAKQNRVIFIESIGLRRPRVGKKDFRRAFRKLRKCMRGLRKIHDNFFVYTPLIMPLHGSKVIGWLNSFLLNLQMGYIMKKLKIKEPVYWTFLPNTVNFLKSKARNLVYYCVDNMAKFEGVDNDAIRDMDNRLTQQAKVVFTVSKSLYDDKRELNKNTYYMPHGVNFEHFAHMTENKPSVLTKLPSPIIGFYGLISKDWVDYKLLSFIARSHPEWTIVMIGKIDTEPGNLPGEKNIHFLGPVDYQYLPTYGRYFDVAIIPFNVNELTYYCNPLKIYEYFAMGKPVVSVDIPEIQRFEDMIYIADNYVDFVKKIEYVLTKQDDTERLKRVEFAQNNSWDKRFKEIWAIAQQYI